MWHVSLLKKVEKSRKSWAKSFKIIKTWVNCQNNLIKSAKILSKITQKRWKNGKNDENEIAKKLIKGKNMTKNVEKLCKIRKKSLNFI